ncbi:hypothetical protein FJ872_30880 [Mesorhizobium sp. B2-5-9]|nr:hypothetical protein FJ872_30880 [Mesorhizobium sp. B2-5-9]TPK81057.1 hypothetical protein FJ936_28505 [Mesorhizobium sp. B2-4-13]
MVANGDFVDVLRNVFEKHGDDTPEKRTRIYNSVRAMLAKKPYGIFAADGHHSAPDGIVFRAAQVRVRNLALEYVVKRPVLADPTVEERWSGYWTGAASGSACLGAGSDLRCPSHPQGAAGDHDAKAQTAGPANRTRVLPKLVKHLETAGSFA